MPQRWLPAAALSLAYSVLAGPAVLSGEMPVSAVAASVVLGAGLVALSVIDLFTLRLPDRIALPLCGLGVVWAAVAGWDSAAWRLAAAALGFASLFAVARVYESVRGRAGLGLGDAKLMALAGAWIGVGGLISVLALASGTALAAVVLWRVRGGTVGMTSAVPFGPFLAGGIWLTWLYGPLAF